MFFYVACFFYSSENQSIINKSGLDQFQGLCILVFLMAWSDEK